LSSPNNPTGRSFSPDRIVRIIKQSKGLVVVDEAYQEFSLKKSFVPLLKKQKNLVILRTLSKVGLAGLRVGFLIADSEITQEVNKVRLPFNLNAVSQRIAIHAIKNRKRMKNNIKHIVSERKRLFREMANMHEVEPFPSDANFILFRLKDSDTIYKGLLKKGVLVRNMRGIVNDCLRVTVGTKRENTFFLKALNQLLP
jgi:histidinol-phosphate aminotransferase